LFLSWCVTANDLYETPVARRTAIGGYEPVGRLLGLAHPHQAEFDCHTFAFVPSACERHGLRRRAR
jgi:hypothetical protein